MADKLTPAQQVMSRLKGIKALDTPNSGKSLGERWKGRRQSSNVVDRTGEKDEISNLIKRMDKEGNEIPSRPKKTSRLPDKAPVPPSRPAQKGPRIQKTQVTPGKWETK